MGGKPFKHFFFKKKNKSTHIKACWNRLPNLNTFWEKLQHLKRHHNIFYKKNHHLLLHKTSKGIS
jgi:hypothetical protein